MCIYVIVLVYNVDTRWNVCFMYFLFSLEIGVSLTILRPPVQNMVRLSPFTHQKEFLNFDLRNPLYIHCESCDPINGDHG